jgi:phytoene/squalene synthetase
MLCEGVRNVNADHAASHIGKAHGFATVVRAIPFHARRNNVYLPYDLMVKVRLLVFFISTCYKYTLRKSAS